MKIEERKDLARVKELESRNKLLERVLEAADSFAHVVDSESGVVLGFQHYLKTLQQAIRAARGGDEKES